MTTPPDDSKPPEERGKTQEAKTVVLGGKPPDEPAGAVIAHEFKSPLGNVPWTLEQFFKGKIDLDKELVARFPNMPLMTAVTFRDLGANTQRGVATLTSSDGAAMLVVDANAASKIVQFSYTYGSMVTLRFKLDNLSDMDRARWLDLIRRKQSGLTFLWGQSRWEQDYIICVSRKYYTSLLAFSKMGFESAVRIKPEVTKALIDWLEKFWKSDHKNEEPPLLSW